MKLKSEDIIKHVIAHMTDPVVTAHFNRISAIPAGSGRVLHVPYESGEVPDPVPAIVRPKNWERIHKKRVSDRNWSRRFALKFYRGPCIGADVITDPDDAQIISIKPIYLRAEFDPNDQYFGRYYDWDEAQQAWVR